MLATAPHTVAFMDIGTNSIRLLIVRIESNNAYTVLHQLKETVRLGEGEFARHRLDPNAISRAVNVARHFALLARNAGAHEMIAVATAATREAENQEDFLSRLREEAGLDVHVVSGLEEARLIYLGVVSGLHLGDRQAFFVDIGGGSTEVIVGTQAEHLYLNSMELGAIRLSNQFLDDEGPITPKRYERIRSHVRNEAAAALHDLRAFPIDFAVGSSGTIENLAEIAARMFWRRPWSRDDVLSYTVLRRTIDELCSLPLESRRRVPGMNPARADIIVGGAAIIDTLLEELAVRELRVSDRGLRDGLLVDYLLRHGYPAFAADVSVRERSVYQLGRSCRFNEDHANTTATLALSLFDSARTSGLHELGAWERELLQYAALLHHIGAFLTYSNYQKHTEYLVRNADLLGFDQTEVAIIASIARYHRGPLPRERDSDLFSLTPDQQWAVRALSTILRLAESLDRSQSGSIVSATFEQIDARRFVLRAQAIGECQVEVWGLDNQLDAFEKVFRRKLTAEITPALLSAASRGS
jgi:exopolyphosphatase / guanosine-5'-triphosphate,3'-diphosphate pyrophosphatase